MSALLDARTRTLLDRQRDLLHKLTEALEAADLQDDARRIRGIADDLAETFLVVVVGEFNSGKSTLINALFGEKLMEVGPIPTTAKVTLVRHGDERFERVLTSHLEERRLPSDLLAYVTIVDTPGTNSIIEEHQQLTEDFVPRADLVLFVTSYEQPLSGSERAFLRFLRDDWGKHFACVINKADLARSPADLMQVVAHVKAGIEDALGFTPMTFAVASSLALEVKLTHDESQWGTLLEQSGFAPFEDFVRGTLAGPQRLRLKLTGPLDAAEARLAALGRIIETRRSALAKDEERLAALVTRLDGTAETLTDVTARTLAEVDGLLSDTEARGRGFLDSAFRATNLRMLRDRDRFREEFARQVLAGLDEQVEARIAAGVDALHERAIKLWHEAVTQLRESVTANAPGMDRQAVLGAIEKEAARQLGRHDVREAARAILENARGSTEMASYGVMGAAGLGVLSGVLVVTTAADLLGGLGALTAGALGVASLTILPRERRRAKRAFSERVANLRSDLRAGLHEQFERHGRDLVTRAGASIRPFEEAVTAEASTLARIELFRDEVSREAAAIRTEFEAGGYR